MSQVFGNLTSDGLEETQDRLGGFKTRESAAYTGVIKAAYAGKAAASNAQNVTIMLDLPDGESRETLWVTNKTGQNFFIDKRDNTKKVSLPGFTVVDDICLVTTNKPLSQQVAEDKVMNVYDPEHKKELPKSVPMLVDLIGKTVTLGMLKEIRNKQVKSTATGEYEDTPETREENLTDKVFHHPSNLTVVEARKGIQTATFFQAWCEKNTGVTRDRRNIKDGVASQGGRPGRPAGAPPTAADSAAKTSSLFS